MKDKIIEILRKELWTAFKKGQRVSPFDADNSEFWAPFFDLDIAPRVASEIEALYKDYYPKEFVEWLAFKSHGNFNPRFLLHKYWDGTNNEWRTTFRTFDGMIWKDITLDELYEYWKTQIRDK